MKTRQTMAAAAITLATIVASSAANATVYIGYSYNSGATVNAGSGPLSAAVAGSIGVFSLNIESGVKGLYPDLLTSSSTDQISSSGAGTLDIYVTLTGLTAPLGSPATFKSGFTQQFLSAGWTVTESTYLDSLNGIYALTSALGTTTFVGPLLTAQAVTQYASAFTGTGPYSVTEKYSITARNAGQSNATIDLMSAVPEPATWAIMLLGFGGIGFMMRRQLRNIAVPFA